MNLRDVPLSVLDLAPVPSGASAGEALRNSINLARHVDHWGYRRYWVAEHHNVPGIASSAPAVLIAHLAQATNKIRVGSGGVMLPNHSPLVVAEQFGMPEALHRPAAHPGAKRLANRRQTTQPRMSKSAAERSRGMIVTDESPIEGMVQTGPRLIRRGRLQGPR